MQSNKCHIKSNGDGRQKVLEEVEKMTVYCNLPKKKALHMRLLAEELSGILYGIVGDYGADFWAEEETGKIKLHLVTDVFLDMEMRSELTQMSSSGKNEEAKGIMGKIRVFVAECMSNYRETTQYCLQNGMETGMVGFSGGYSAAGYWSLQQYKEDIAAEAGEKRAEWDELEKSIVANLADDITVGINNRQAEIVVTMNI